MATEKKTTASTVKKAQYLGRRDILERASDATTGKRQEDYGTPEDNFALIANFWTNYLGNRLTGEIHPADVANMMILLKMARLASGVATLDGFVDIAGYAACGGEILGFTEG